MKTAIGLAEPNRDEELARLRELLWMRLAVGAYRDRAVAHHVIDEVRGVGQKFARDGAALERRKDARGFGRWLKRAGRGFQDFADTIEAVWRGAP